PQQSGSYLGYSCRVGDQRMMTARVKGFGCRPLTDGAANTEAWGRRPKASKEGNRGKWHAVVLRALWGFERGRRGA
ncbi:MAG TPA: hypothetical protein VK561_13175, partial [Bradyrhizobium sp.]|nr:hypothetical protein [Bradyrhizobium sp.]